ncbi:MAG: ATP-binding cassette domain-containing protein, partial [Desulfurococcales archaeon]|nr:ATP-binding cassette domain-containing protein [Desulfurococcales archaeon]
VAGIAGNGQRELFEAIAGLVKPSRGRIILGGEDVTRLPPRERLRRGLSLIPEERLGWAVVPGKSILYNASIPIASRNGAGILIRGEWVRRVAVRVVESTGVKTASLGDPVDSLSGGNMQRLVVGRELLYRPRSLVAMNITAGLDYRAASRVREMILDAASRGSGILLIDEDLDLLTEVADRIIVLSRGRVTGEFKPPYNIEDIAASMTLG